MSNVELDRQALKLAKPYIGEVAWPTVYLCIGCVVSFVLVIYLSVAGFMPYWLGMIINSFVLYSIQTPLHEAVHGNIAGRDRRYMWLNHLVGFISGAILIHEYKMFRLMHTYHHRETNNPDFDPDHWVFAKHPILVFLKCLTIPLNYHYYFFTKLALNPEHRWDVIHIVAVYFVLYGIVLWPSVFGFHWEILMLWYFPHVFASGMIVFFFGYLVHPEEHQERYRNTKIHLVNGTHAKPVNWVWYFQGFHLIHHLFPRIPFYRYPQAFRDLRPILEKAGSEITVYGKEEAPQSPGRAGGPQELEAKA